MQSHQDALRNNRNYLGTKKEVLRVLKRSKSEHPKKKSFAKNPPQSDEECRKKWPLQILVDEADRELSDATDSDFGDILPPTPKPPSPP